VEFRTAKLHADCLWRATTHRHLFLGDRSAQKQTGSDKKHPISDTKCLVYHQKYSIDDQE
jgi:hypothetical protein